MNKREKILTMAIGILVVFGLGGLIVNQLLLSPWKNINSQTNEVNTKIFSLKKKNKLENIYLDKLNNMTTQSLGNDKEEVSEQSRARLVKYLNMANLATEKFSLTPVTGKRISKKYQEVGWNIRGRGSLDVVVDFLYLIQSDPYVHRLSNLVLTYSTAPYEVDIQVRWMTMVMPARKDQSQGALDEPKANPLNEPARKPYDLIAQRDMFRPYIKKPEEPVRTVEKPDSNNEPRSNNTPPARPMTRLVGLSDWGGENVPPEVTVFNTGSGQTTQLNMGDELAGGKIVLVDYRWLPLANDPMRQSPSRVILEIENNYWAIELGFYAKDKYQIPNDRLPAELSPQAAMEP